MHAGPRFHTQHWHVVVLLCRGVSKLASTTEVPVHLRGCHPAAVADHQAASAAAAAVPVSVHSEQHAETLPHCSRRSTVHGMQDLLLFLIWALCHAIAVLPKHTMLLHFAQMTINAVNFGWTCHQAHEEMSFSVWTGLT